MKALRGHLRNKRKYRATSQEVKEYRTKPLMIYFPRNFTSNLSFGLTTKSEPFTLVGVQASRPSVFGACNARLLGLQK